MAWAYAAGLSAVLLLLACSTEDVDTNAPDSGGNTSDASQADAPADVAEDVSDGGCAPPNVWRYATPGCGAAAAPSCGDPNQDACAIMLCSCSGQTISGCQWASEPWQSYGPCDAGAD